MLNVMSFDLSSHKLIDNTLETKVEVSSEEKNSEKNSDENFITNISKFYLKETQIFRGFYFSPPIVNQLYLNNIFKPPISLYS
jgi:hypothetical protein